MALCASHLGSRGTAWPVTARVSPPCCSRFLALAETGQLSQPLCCSPLLLLQSLRVTQPGEMFLLGSPFHESSLRADCFGNRLLHENIDVPNTQLFKSERLLVSPFDWYRCDLEVNYIANFIQNKLPHARH